VSKKRSKDHNNLAAETTAPIIPSFYAVATTDTAFKHMLSPSIGEDSSIVISLLNSFIPAFTEDPI
jgi:hypothetical protein